MSWAGPWGVRAPGGHLCYLPPRTLLQGGRTKERKQLEGRGPAWTEAGASLPFAPCQGRTAKMQRLVGRALSLEGLVLQSERGLPSASGVSRGRVSMGWAGDLSFEKRLGNMSVLN